MKITKRFDIILNVISPILLGYLIYFIYSIEQFSIVIKNYLPDGLWAYSFISMILVIWHRQLNLCWMISAYLLAACFEVFQYLKLVPGTADIIDVTVYIIFITIGIGTNNFFRKAYCKPPQ
jgi:hypothetical protein